MLFYFGFLFRVINNCQVINLVNLLVFSCLVDNLEDFGNIFIKFNVILSNFLIGIKIGFF